MAFVQKSGSSFLVRQGNNNRILSRFQSRKEADDERDRLHRRNKPKSLFRGASARKMFTSAEMMRKRRQNKK